MLELILCSLLTVFPDYLFRRYAQGKRLGREITIFSVWFELRWGITACVVLTITLITVIFYYHPSAKNATMFFRTISILPEGSGRVEKVFIGVREEVKAGQPLFKLDSSEQEAAMETARRRIAEVQASLEVAQSELSVADARVKEARGAYMLSSNELNRKAELQRRNPDVVAAVEIQRLRDTVETRLAGVSAALSARQAAAAQISSVLPAQKASAEAALAEAEIELAKTVVYAGVDGTVEQFTLREGDIVARIARPAGVLIPSEAGRRALIAGFGQIEAQVIKRGMIAEATCSAKPMTIIPMVVTEVQDVIASGQVRIGEQLVDAQQVIRPGTLTVFLEPLYKGGVAGLPPGASCIANVYTNNHDQFAAGGLSTSSWLFLHAVDAVAIVHALLLRVQALLLPVQTLVFSGH